MAIKVFIKHLPTNHGWESCEMELRGFESIVKTFKNLNESSIVNLALENGEAVILHYNILSDCVMYHKRAK